MSFPRPLAIRGHLPVGYATQKLTANCFQKVSTSLSQIHFREQGLETRVGAVGVKGRLVLKID